MPPSPVHPTDPRAHPAESARGGIGPLFGAAIVILLLLLAAFYFWGEYLNKRQNSAPPSYIPSDTGASASSSAQ